MGRPRSHGPATADALLAAAERVAAADGPAALSVRRVAADVGTTTRAVYSLFGSKDGLVVALATHGFQLLQTDLDARPASRDPTDELVDVGAVVFRRFVVEHPVLFRISFQRESVTPALVAGFDHARRAALARLIGRFERLAASGRLRGRTPAAAATCFHALCEGLAALELRSALPPDADRVWRDALGALLAGLEGGARRRASRAPLRGAPSPRRSPRRRGPGR